MSLSVRRPYRVVAEWPAQAGYRLAHIRFGAAATAQDEPGIIAVPLPVLAGPAQEYWLSAEPVQTGWLDGVGYAENGTVLFGHLQIDSATLQTVGATACGTDAYQRIERVLQQRGYPCCLRTWNFLEGINDGEGDAERYRQFSAGRYQAVAARAAFEASLPAATAIGMGEGGLILYFLAARTPGRQVENPRQVSAFDYPRQYGPTSPSFSRAVQLGWADHGELLVSGTASVVGHETRHVGDAEAQLAEIFVNLEALQTAAGGGFAPEHLKLYAREPVAVGPLLARLQQRFPALPVTVLRGDICRRDLLVEIEAIYGQPAR